MYLAHARCWCFGLMFFSPLSMVWAQEGTTLTLKLSTTLQSESNLLRLPASALATTNSAENVAVTTVGMRLNFSQSLQKFELSANLTDYKYQNFKQLSLTANSVAARWRWSVTPRINGNLAAERKQTVNSFDDLPNFNQPNERTDASTRLDTVVELAGPWRLLAGTERTSQTNQQVLVGSSDYSSHSANLGLRLDYGTGSTLTYGVKTQNGSYLNRLPNAANLFDDGFRQIDQELRLHWVATGKTNANFNLSFMERSHPNYAQRDFTGFNAGVDANWAFSGKSSLNSGYSHMLASFQTNYASFSRTHTFWLAPVWQISPKTVLSLRHARAQIEFLGDPSGSPSPARSDATQDTALSFNWQPTTQLTLGAAWQKVVRSSSLIGLDYQSTLATLSAQYSY